MSAQATRTGRFTAGDWSDIGATLVVDGDGVGGCQRQCGVRFAEAFLGPCSVSDPGPWGKVTRADAHGSARGAVPDKPQPRNTRRKGGSTVGSCKERPLSAH